MMPALVDQERIFINKSVYRFGIGEISRGDMVVFWFPGDPTKSYIKRVIGVPGDTVEVDNGTVIVNNKRLEESYVLTEYRDRQSMAPFKVQQDEYFVMGDHRSSSNRQPVLGTGAAKIHLRQGRVCLLATREDGHRKVVRRLRCESMRTSTSGI